MSGAAHDARGGPDEQRAEAAAFELANALATAAEIESVLGLLCERAVDLLGASAAGVFRTDTDTDTDTAASGLTLAAASAVRDSCQELLAMQGDHDGPVRTCHATGFAVTAPDLSVGEGGGELADALRAAGIARISAYPVEQGTTQLGVLCTFHDRPGVLDPGTLRVGGLLGAIAAAALVFGPADAVLPCPTSAPAAAEVTEDRIGCDTGSRVGGVGHNPVGHDRDAP